MIRKAEPSDLAAVHALMTAYVTPPWSESATLDAINNERCTFLVDCDGGALNGYVCIETVLGEGCVMSIAVSEDRLRSGLGGALLDAALSAAGAESVYLEVCESNAAAIALYSSRGFRTAGERKKYYGEKSAYIMRKGAGEN